MKFHNYTVHKNVFVLAFYIIHVARGSKRKRKIFCKIGGKKLLGIKRLLFKFSEYTKTILRGTSKGKYII